MMDRLTIRREHGIVMVDGYDFGIDPDDYDVVQEILARLAAYEDTGLMPEDVLRISNLLRLVGEDFNCRLMFVAQALVKYAEYTKAESEGRLVVLPCKVGQTVYKISHYHDCVDNLYETCDLFAYDEGACSRCYKDKLVPHIREVGFELSMLDEIGNTVFVSREEAEAALAKDMNVPINDAADINVGSKQEVM